MDEKTIDKISDKKNITWHHLPILLVLAGLLFFLGLGKMGLTDRDEGLNAEAAREMAETGDWLSPTFNYQPRLQKPALLYWLIGTAYGMFGVSEFSARFPSALFGLFLILLQYAFVKRVRGPTVAFLSSLILLLNFEVLAIGRMVLTDSVLIFFITSALFAFWLGLHGQGRDRHYFWWFYIGISLAVLTKGPIGLVLPMLVVLCYLFCAGRFAQFWRRGHPLLGTLLFILLTSPWYVAMFRVHGMDYLSQLRVDHLHRFLFPMEGHGGTVFFYIPVLFLGFFPWSIFLPVAWFQGIKDLKKVRGGISREIPGQGSEGELECFAALWVAILFSFFTAASTRLPHYLGPLFPASAMLVAIYFDQSKKVGLLARSFKFRTVAFGMAATMIFSLQILSIEVILPHISRSFISPAQDLAARAGRMLGGKGALLLYGIPRPSLVFYARHKAIMMGEGQEEKLSTLLHASQLTLLLLPSRLQSRLPTEAKGLTTVMQLGDVILLGKGF